MQHIQNVTTKTPIEIALGVDENNMTTAKKLYAFLGLHPATYARWFKTNITENEFAEENIDYFPFNTNVECGGQVSQDAKLTAHFAKKLSCKGNGERAEQAREYFSTLDDKVKEITINRSQLSPQMQMFYALADNQAQIELEQKRQAEQLNRIEQKQEIIVETFQKTDDTESFQKWANDRITQIAESPKFDRGQGRKQNYVLARSESYERLKNKRGCNLNDRVERAKGRAITKNPSIKKADLDRINKISIIANDKDLKPAYELVIKEMMIAYCVEV